MRVIPPLALLAFCALTLLHVSSRRARRWVWKAMLVLALALGVTGAWVGLAWAPPDRHMGDLTRIMYVHVPLVWMGLLALVVNFFASVAWLLHANRTADALAEAAAEVGVALGVLGLALGALWGRPTWGVWWSWDPRMTATVVMLGLYTAYLVVRRVVRTEATRALASALVALLVSVVLPIVVFSVKWWSSLHQLPSTPKTVDPDILAALLWNTAAFLCGFFVLTFHRYRIARFALDEEASRLRASVAAHQPWR